MEIKTIRYRLDNAAEFDMEVNTALADGWRLVKREVLQPLAQSENVTFYAMLYAELAKDDPPKEAAPAPKDITWQEAVRYLRDYCKSVTATECNKGICPMASFCGKYFKDRWEHMPCNWEVPGDE